MTNSTARDAALVVRVEKTVAGPALWIGSVQVRTWLGTMYDGAAEKLAQELEAEIGNDSKPVGEQREGDCRLHDYLMADEKCTCHAEKPTTDLCDVCDAPQNVLPNGEHACAAPAVVAEMPSEPRATIAERVLRLLVSRCRVKT